MKAEVIAWCAMRQEHIALQYKQARDLNVKYPLAIEIAELQKQAAEASQHIRWLLGIDQTCSCCAHRFAAHAESDMTEPEPKQCQRCGWIVDPVTRRCAACQDDARSFLPLAVESKLDGTCSKCGEPCVDTRDITGDVPLLCGACMFYVGDR